MNVVHLSVEMHVHSSFVNRVIQIDITLLRTTFLSRVIARLTSATRAKEKRIDK